MAMSVSSLSLKGTFSGSCCLGQTSQACTHSWCIRSSKLSKAIWFLCRHCCCAACVQADITAKGESVANLADIMGTIAGILLSKWKLPMVPTFMVLSCGYLLASRKEVDSVELPYLNRARLALTSTHFLKSGGVGSGGEGEDLVRRSNRGAICSLALTGQSRTDK